VSKVVSEKLKFKSILSLCLLILGVTVKVKGEIIETAKAPDGKS
jgi:hypothetical protein